MSFAPPFWIDVLSAVLVAVGGLAALIGSLGLLRLETFFQRVHAPTLGATVGTWSFVLATVLQISFIRGQLYAHAVLIAAFIAVTAPITTVFLMRAAAFRAKISAQQSRNSRAH